MTPTNLGLVSVLNTTPHPIRFVVNGVETEVPPCGVLIDATVEQTVVREANGVSFLRTVHRPSARGNELLERWERGFPGVVIVGSVIAAQAYPGRVCSLVPVAGLERVPVDHKRFRGDAFGTFESPASSEFSVEPGKDLA